jgi:hypothetical protein
MLVDVVIAQVDWLSILSIGVTVASIVASFVIFLLPFVLG